MVSGAPPLANLAVRPRQGIEAAWQPALLRVTGTRHQIVAGGGWKTSEPRNRFTTPSGMNLITADGRPHSQIEFNTPLDSRETRAVVLRLRRGPRELDGIRCRSIWALSPISRAARCRLNRARRDRSYPARTFARAAGSDRLEQSCRRGLVSRGRSRICTGSFFAGAYSRSVSRRLPGGISTSEIRTAWAATPINGSRPIPLVSARRTRRPAATLRRTLLVDLASSSPALIG